MAVLARLPGENDTVFLSVDDTKTEVLSKVFDEADAAIIAVATYESPSALKATYDLNAHAVMNKPIPPNGVLSQFTVAQHCHKTEARMSAQVQKVEDTLRGRRQVDKAVRLIIDMHGMEEDAAYRLIRTGHFRACDDECHCKRNRDRE